MAKYKLTIISIILFIILIFIFFRLNIISTLAGIDRIIGFLSIIIAAINADMSRINAKKSKDAANQSQENVKLLQQLKEKSISEALCIERNKKKETELHIKMSKDKQEILSLINKSLIYLKADEGKANKIGIHYVSLSDQFLNSIQNLVAYFDLYKPILDMDIIIDIEDIKDLLKKFLELDGMNNFNNTYWSKNDVFQLGTKLLKIKKYFT